MLILEGIHKILATISIVVIEHHKNNFLLPISPLKKMLEIWYFYPILSPSLLPSPPFLPKQIEG